MEYLNSLRRRELLKGGAAGAVLLTGSGLIAACGGSSSSNGAAQTGAAGGGGRPKRGGTLTIAMATNGKSETVHPGKLNTSPDYLRVRALFDPLFVTIGDNELRNWLAESAEPSRDAKRWTIRLRSGVTFHDGKPLTSEDLLYSVRSWTLEDNTIASSTFRPLIDLARTRKVDDVTVEIALTRPLAAFPYYVANATSGCSVIQAGTRDFTRPVGTGPFMYDSFTPGDRSRFVANREYWLTGQPYVDELVVDSSFSDESARVNAVLSGAANVVPTVSPTLARANRSNPKITMSDAPSPLFIAFAARVDQAPFNDPRVLEAVKLMIDRQAMVDNVFYGYATIGNDLPGAGQKFFDSSRRREYDPEKARALLNQAGQSGLRLRLTTSDVTAGFVESATLFAQQAKEIGVTVDLDRVDAGAYYTSDTGFLTRPLSMTRWVNTGSLASLNAMALTTNAPINETHYGDKRTDALFNDAVATIDDQQASERWLAVQEAQWERGGYIIPTNINVVDGVAPNVRGLGATPAGSLNNFALESAWIDG